jgi:hypothetical protein
MSETLPDRLSIDPKSPYYNEPLVVRGVRIRLSTVDPYLDSLPAAEESENAGEAIAEKIVVRRFSDRLWE